jgi:enterochelin esterase-like enzyme
MAKVILMVGVLLALLVAACGTGSPESKPSPAPPTAAVATDVPEPATPAAVPTAELSDEALLDRAMKAVEALNGASSLEFSKETTGGGQTTVVVNGKPAQQQSSSQKVADRGTLVVTGGKRGARLERTRSDIYSDLLAGSQQEWQRNQEMRLVDGTFYISGTISGPSLEWLPSPQGWIKANTIAGLLPWTGLDWAAVDQTRERMQGETVPFLFGWKPSELRSILSKTLAGITRGSRTLEDGRAVETIQMKLKKDALRALAEGIKFDNPVNYAAFQMISGTPATVTFLLDAAGNLVGWERDIYASVQDLKVGQNEGLPDGSVVSGSLSETAVGRLASIGGPVSAVTAPNPAEMAKLPAYSGGSQGGEVPFSTLDKLIEALETAASSDKVDPLWNQILAFKQMPLIYGDIALFLYRGDAARVDWSGDWSSIVSSAGHRLGKTSLWMAAAPLPADARLEYQIVLGGQDYILDPLNPLVETGGLGSKSVVEMPDYVAPDFVRPRDDVPPGALTDNLTIASQKLGYAVNYRVYTPAGYAPDAQTAGLPAIYVTDGQDFLQFGKMQVILDNLIADGKIEPIIAVFIDPRDTATGQNLREKQFLNNPDYGAFIAEELVPAIDAAFKTDPSADARAILGASYGGYLGAYFAPRHFDLFHLIGILSPVVSYDPTVLDAWQQADRLPLKIFVAVGAIGDVVNDARQLRAVLEAKGYPLQYIEANGGHSYGTWRGVLDDLLIYFFGKE